MKAFLTFAAAFAIASFAYSNREYKFETETIPEAEEVAEVITPAIETVLNEWDLFIEAVIWKESRGAEDCIGDSGKAVGVLQIHPIMVREANRILAMNNAPEEKLYTYNDRYSREKSIEIFKIVQDYHNKSHDFDRALQIWNHNHPMSYKTDIMAKYKELKG